MNNDILIWLDQEMASLIEELKVSAERLATAGFP
jgi:hypothetical protein